MTPNKQTQTNPNKFFFYKNPIYNSINQIKSKVMKQSMTRQNFRKVSNNIRNFRPNTVMALIAMASFGMKAFSFISSLLTVGCTPFEGLTTKQLKQMWFLRAMNHC